VEHALRAFHRPDREVGSGGVADEQRVARQQEPRLVRAGRVRDSEAAVLGPVAGRVDAAEPHVPDDELGAVLERVAGVPRLGERVDADGHAVVDGEPAVARDVVGVGVRLERPHDAGLEAFRFGEDRLDREVRVDDHDLAGLLAPDEIRGAAEVVVEDLCEEHGRRR
jgi:hypothetical protein